VTLTPTASATPTPDVPAELDLSAIEGIEGFAVFNADKTATVTIGGEKFEGIHLDGVVNQIDANTLQVAGWYARLDAATGQWTIDMKDVVKVMAPLPGEDGKLKEDPEKVLPNFDPRDMSLVNAYYVDAGVAPVSPFLDGKKFGLTDAQFKRLRFDQIKLVNGNNSNGDGSRKWQIGHKIVVPLEADGLNNNLMRMKGKAYPLWPDLEAPAVYLKGLGVGWNMTIWDQSGQVLRSTAVMPGERYPLWSTKLNERSLFDISLVATGNGTEVDKFLQVNNAPVLGLAVDGRIKTLTALPEKTIQDTIFTYEFGRNASSFEQAP